jgi:hypothetical protein
LSDVVAFAFAQPRPRDAQIAKSLTLDEARRIASNIAKLSALLSRKIR